MGLNRDPRLGACGLQVVACLDDLVLANLFLSPNQISFFPGSHE